MIQHYLGWSYIHVYIYFILSSEINAYKKQIKVISVTSEIISLYFHCSIFRITSDFSIHLMHFTSELQTPITFLFVKENIKCGDAFETNILVPKYPD